MNPRSRAKAVVSPWSGREDAPRRLRRKGGSIFWPCLFPAEAAGAHPPGPRATSRWWPGKKHYGSARGLSTTSVTQPVYKILHVCNSCLQFPPIPAIPLTGSRLPSTLTVLKSEVLTNRGGRRWLSLTGLDGGLSASRRTFNHFRKASQM